MRTFRAAGAGAMLVLMLGGCGAGPEPEEARSAMESSRDQVERRLTEAVDALREAGMEMASATGEWSACRMDPKPGMEFYAGGSMSGGDGSPAERVTAATEAGAIEAARWIGEALGYVGVFAVEMFVVGEGAEESVVVNEIAPRVHNSGHWTSEGAETSQFHQHVRAVCGFPLGSARRRGHVEMENLIGDAALRWRELLAEPGAHLHLYGKREARAGRKMGHVTRVSPEKA